MRNKSLALLVLISMLYLYLDPLDIKVSTSNSGFHMIKKTKSSNSDSYLDICWPKYNFVLTVCYMWSFYLNKKC